MIVNRLRFAVLLFGLLVSRLVVAGTPEAESFSAARDRDFAQASKIFHQLESIDGPKTVENVLVPLNNLWVIMDRSLNLSRLYQSVHPDQEMREISATYEQKFSKLYTEIQLSRLLYDAVSAVDLSGIDAKTRRFAEHTLRDFRRAGVDKDPETRAKIKKLQEELVLISQNFDKNIREDVRSIILNSVDELKGLPEDYIKAHAPDADGKITITTDYPDYIPFMSYASSDARRLELYKEFRRRGYPANQQVLTDLLAKRYQLARLLGYDNYAQYITEDKMIQTPQAAAEFIKKVATVADERASQDYDELLHRLQQDDPNAKEVGDWQKTYIEELVKKENYDFDSRLLRPYFPYEKVRNGLFSLTGEMFKLAYEKVDTIVWDPAVEVYDMYDMEKGKHRIGRFYLDMHPRKDKFKHAMMSEVVTGVKNGHVPEAALVCNFPGGDNGSGLMEHEQVLTFFHEFGHLLHHMLGGNQPWIKLSGITTEWDFVETPSTLLEEWPWNLEILKTFAINDAGQTIPDELITRMNRARKFSLGLDVKQQMFYAAISLNFYNRKNSSFEPLEMVKKLQKEYTPFAYVPDTYMYLAFGHLTDYSAIYYTYMWSEVIAKDLFSVFQAKGLTNPEVALQYRQKILQPGGSRDAADMVKDFLGRPYSFEAFKNWLNGDQI